MLTGETIYARLMVARDEYSEMFSMFQYLLPILKHAAANKENASQIDWKTVATQIERLKVFTENEK
jgi:hypothetical protein